MLNVENAGVCAHRPWFPQARSARAPDCDAPCRERARPFVLAATILGSSMAFIDGTVVNLALPVIQTNFNIEFDLVQWVVNAYMLFLGALILTGGALGDHYGRRRVYVVGVILFALASIACALAPGAWWLIGARAIQGIGAALLVPQSLAIIAASFPREVRGHAIGTWAAAAAITTAAGPILGGALIDWLGWRAVFWINIPLAAAAVALSWGYVPESRARRPGRLDWSGSILVTVSLALLVYALTAIPELGFADRIVLASLTAGLVLLGSFLWIESRAASPIMPLGLFRQPTFSVVNGVTFCLYFALSGMLFLLPYNLIQVHGYSPFQAGMALLPFGVVMGLFSSRAGGLADRFGPRTPLSTGSILVALACMVLVLIESGYSLNYWLGYFPAILLFSIGMTVCVAPLTTAVMNAVPDSATGVASGINNTMSRIAGVFAVALVGLAVTLVFTSVLAGNLSRLAIPAPAGEVLMANAHKLAALQVPDNLATGISQNIQAAIEHAFRSGYRIAMGAAAIGALLAAGLAWFGLGQVSKPNDPDY